MPVLDLTFEVYCTCKAGLCNQTTEGRTPGRGEPFITVEPCERCLEAARDEGYSKGYEAGFGEGIREGYDEGYSRAYHQAQMRPTVR